MTMEAVSGASGRGSLIDVLDRVLDKGIVIDAWLRISLVGIDLISVEARIVVASIDTYLKYAEAIGMAGVVARPVAEAPRPQREALTGAEEPAVSMDDSEMARRRRTSQSR